MTIEAPGGVTAQSGAGQVTVRWEPVPEAIGYAVHRAPTADGPFTVVDHGGDVLAVPHGPYADTTEGRGGFYAVAALRTVTDLGPLSDPVPGSPVVDSEDVHVTVGPAGRPLPRIWRELVGSEHLSHLLCTDTTGGREIGAGLRDALRRVHDELGVRAVRAHHILGDDLGVYREINGGPVYDFSAVDKVFDIVRETGLAPVVEFGFMPRDLAADPTRTVFDYRAIVSPPKDWDRWAALIRAFTAHVTDRYGAAEVRDRWAFEVWSDHRPVCWAGTPADYRRLGEVTVGAVRDVDPALRVGAPLTAPPADFVSAHGYGTVPLDLRPLAAGRPVRWSGWGVTGTHGSPLNDSVFAAAFLLKGMRSAAGRVEALSPGLACDHAEELGRPGRLLHGGAGLLTVGNLAKPTFWALALAERLGGVELPVTLTGDGAGSLVEAWASRYDDADGGGFAVLLWNSTLDQGRAVRAGGELVRRVRLQIALPGPHWMRVWRVDAAHGNIAARWSGEWPSPDQWAELAAADRLTDAEPRSRVRPGKELLVDVPSPGIVFVELRPVTPSIPA